MKKAASLVAFLFLIVSLFAQDKVVNSSIDLERDGDQVRMVQTREFESGGKSTDESKWMPKDTLIRDLFQQAYSSQLSLDQAKSALLREKEVEISTKSIDDLLVQLTGKNYTEYVHDLLIQKYVGTWTLIQPDGCEGRIVAVDAEGSFFEMDESGEKPEGGLNGQIKVNTLSRVVVTGLSSNDEDMVLFSSNSEATVYFCKSLDMYMIRANK